MTQSLHSPASTSRGRIRYANYAERYVPRTTIRLIAMQMIARRPCVQAVRD